MIAYTEEMKNKDKEVANKKDSQKVMMSKIFISIVGDAIKQGIMLNAQTYMDPKTNTDFIELQGDVEGGRLVFSTCKGLVDYINGVLGEAK